MSGKRFSVENERTVKDNYTYDCFVCSWKTEAEELVNLLNSLSEENERLIEKRGELETKNVMLKKENEQLKKRVDKLKVIMAEFGATLLMNGFDIEVDDNDLMEMINNE